MDLGEIAVAHVDARASTPICGPARAGSRVDVGDDDVARARVPDDRAAMMPIGPAPVISTSSPSTGNVERGVHRVAERVEDRRDVEVDARPGGARRSSSAARRTRRTRRRG